MASRLALALLWLLHWLPMPLLARVGRGLGALLHAAAGSRRRIARRNLELCFPELSDADRRALVRDHFGWLGRSIVERAVLWYAGEARIRALITVEGDVHFAERSTAPVMWLVPHFVALDIAATAVQLFQTRRGATIYQAQSDPAFDAAVRAGRSRFGGSVLFSRKDGAKPLIRAIRKDGLGFFNLPDMDFGRRESAFVPFFGVPAATLLAPGRMARLLGMKVQPVVAEFLPGGAGWKVRFLEPWSDWPTDDAEADAARMNRWIEGEVRRNPAQYLWVHKRFKTRPQKGEPSLYGRERPGKLAAPPDEESDDDDTPSP
jgi:Kdo2-lipid IVA lauroyltransferase/acyltransferase